MHRPPGGQGRNGVRRAQSWKVGLVGDAVPPWLEVSRFFVMLVFQFCKLLSITANLSQTNSPIIKTKHFKVTKYIKKYGRYLGQSG